ncbi:MAG: branched-chain amino acid ABC transporter permease [Alphaproteobacteria bacterium]
MDILSSVLLSGVVLGSLYALMATGLALVWTTLGIFNFAHGIFIALGAYVAWQFGTEEGFGLGATIGIVAAVSLLAALGCLIERTLVRPFLGHRNLVLAVVITTLAALIFLENSALLVWGPRFKQLPPLVDGTLAIGGLDIAAHEVLIVLLSPALLLALWAFLRLTYMGAALRAVSQNQDAALMVGIPVPVLFALAFGISAALAAIAGVLLGSIRFITPAMGNEPLVKALIVAIFGGLGSISGTIGGAYVIGMLEAVCVYFIGLYWTPAALFLCMILVLLVRPQGLFGRVD